MSSATERARYREAKELAIRLRRDDDLSTEEIVERIKTSLGVEVWSDSVNRWLRKAGLSRRVGKPRRADTAPAEEVAARLPRLSDAEWKAAYLASQRAVRRIARRWGLSDLETDRALGKAAEEVVCRAHAWDREQMPASAYGYLQGRDACRYVRAVERGGSRAGVYHDSLAGSGHRLAGTLAAEPERDTSPQAAVCAAVDALPEEDRALVVLHFYGGLSVRGACHLLGRTQGWGRSHLPAALDALRQILAASATHG